MKWNGRMDGIAWGHHPRESYLSLPCFPYREPKAGFKHCTGVYFSSVGGRCLFDLDLSLDSFFWIILFLPRYVRSRSIGFCVCIQGVEDLIMG